MLTTLLDSEVVGVLVLDALICFITTRQIFYIFLPLLTVGCSFLGEIWRILFWRNETSSIEIATLLKLVMLILKEANTAENFTQLVVSMASPLCLPMQHQLNNKTSRNTSYSANDIKMKNKKMFTGTRTWYESADLEKERFLSPHPNKRVISPSEYFGLIRQRKKCFHV